MWYLLLALLPAVFAEHLPGNPDEYFDILGSGKAEWRLAFRGTAHIRESVYDAYRTGSNIPPNVDDNCKMTNWSAPCTSHYRNDDALDHWHNVEEVIFGIIDDGMLVQILKFNGLGTSYMSWFEKAEYISSCYADLKDASTNFFSIQGDDRLKRRFYINHQYGGCPNDAGWFVAVDRPNTDCSWETGEPFPYFKYVAGSKMANLNTPSFKSADAIAVFLKYLPGKPEEYFDVLGTGLKEWRLAFRGTAGVGASVYQAYLDGSGIPPNVDEGCKKTNYYAPCSSHYRNDLALDHWDDIEYVLFGVVAQGEMVKKVIFRGDGTTFTSWMSQTLVHKSCWSDLTTATTNFFSIQGDSNLRRRFFMNHQYTGCHNDAGWFVAVDNPVRPCPWEVNDEYPYFLVSGSPTLENYSEGHIRKADALVVFLKYKHMH